MLAVGKFGWERLGAMDLIPAGHAIGEPALLFEKIEDDVIQRQLDKLRRPKQPMKPLKLLKILNLKRYGDSIRRFSENGYSRFDDSGGRKKSPKRRNC